MARVGLALCVSTALLGGCASGGIVDKGLDLVGLAKKPEVPQMPTELPAGLTGDLPSLNGAMPTLPSQRQVALRIHGGQVLNTDASGRSLALVVRIYKLRGTTQFSQATYAMFAASTPDQPIRNEDIISAKEVVLVPGQKYEVIEPMPSGATHLAVVALFRSPDPSRWRFMFDAKAAARTGITLGVHGCAMSVAVGEPFGAPPDALRVAGVLCG